MCQGIRMQQQIGFQNACPLEFTEMLQIVPNFDIVNSGGQKGENGPRYSHIHEKNAAGTGQKSQGFLSGIQTSVVSMHVNRGKENHSFPNYKK